MATRYSDRFANPYEIHFDVVSVERDGQPEEFHLEKLSNGLRIYMGKSIGLVSPGQHTYELTYTVDRELGFFPDHDELYWNVTGNGWIFPVETVSATVHLPGGIVPAAVITDAYTGRQGSAETDYTASADNQGNVMFRTNRALAPFEGLTIVARWPKGFVSPPTDEMQHHFFVEDNEDMITGVLGLLVVLIYYAAVWFLMGRAGGGGEIVPQPEPPRGFSPAAVRYVWRMAFDQKAVITNLVDLAIKKRLAILEDVTGGFILGRVPAASGPGTGSEPAAHITSDEKLILGRLLAAGDTIELARSRRALVGGAVEALHQHLRTKMEKVYFLANLRYLLPGLLISLATVVRSGLFIQGAREHPIWLLTIGLLLGSPVCLTLVLLAVNSWRYALADPQHAAAARKQALLISAISTLFVVGEVVGLGAMEWAASLGVAIILSLLIGSGCTFHLLMRTPTRSGRALMDRIEGFRMFLTATEQERRPGRAAATIAPSLFERLLPYAMALNVEKVWNEKFAATLAPTTRGQAVDYAPTWYSGPAWDRIVPGSFANSLGNSFTSAIATSTRAPSTSSSGKKTAGGG